MSGRGAAASHSFYAARPLIDLKVKGWGMRGEKEKPGAEKTSLPLLCSFAQL